MKVRLGIIGLGGIARRFASVLQIAGGAELYAVGSRNINTAMEFGKEYNAKKAYGSYEDLINDKDVQAVYIALPHNMHFEYAKKCINAGKAVLCEKPFFITEAEAIELFDLAKEKNVLVMEAMWTRCLPANQQAKRWIDQGAIGKVSLIEASFCFNFPYDPNHRLYDPNLAGGALYDAGVYPIEFAMDMAGAEPKEVKSVTNFAPNGVDKYNAIGIKFKNDVLASLSCGISAKTSTDAYIYGSEGHICVKDFLRTQEVFLYDNQDELKGKFCQYHEDGFIYEIDHFVSLYNSGEIQSPLITWNDTITCAGIFDKVKQSK